jgi:hypoxanthine-DNA glycosylase
MAPSARIACFPPIINRASTVLILGSMPSVRSLQTQQYYGHPQNQFWKLIAELLGVKKWKDYAHKKETILKHGIALWDVLDSCLREGSMDAAIREHRVNDLEAFLKKYPRIKVIFCDSGTAFKLLQKKYKVLPVPVFVLPSPSPAYTIPFKTKLSAWTKILDYLT